MQLKRKFGLAMAAYALLGLAAWFTLDDTPFRLFDVVAIKFRAATLVVLGGFALKSAIYWWRCKIEEEDSQREREGPAEQALSKR